MPVTTDLLKQQETLQNLSNDQLEAVVTLTKNELAKDVQSEIGARIKEVHDRYDTDFAEVTGLKKESNEKTYDFARRVLTDLSTKAKAHDTGAQELQRLQAEKTELERKIKEGAGDKELAAKVTQYERDLKETTDQVKALKDSLKSKDSEKEQALTQKEQELETLRMGFVFAQATQGLKIKAGIPEQVADVYMKQAQQDFANAFKVEIREIDGRKIDIVVDRKTGDPVRNAKDMSNPYTPKAKLAEMLAEIMEPPKQVSGTGGNGNGTGAGTAGINLSGIVSKSAAVTIIRKALVQDGLMPGTEIFADAMQKQYQELGVSNLPEA